MNTELLDKAVIFATHAHSGTERRGHNFPYIIHPLEAVSIVASITTDQELLAAAALHDVLEDTDITYDEIYSKFGERIANLVSNESDIELEGSLEDTWHARKQFAIDRLKHADIDTKIVAIGDKLSNMRIIARDYKEKGDDFWKIFHVSDPHEHEWHYRGLADSLLELSDTQVYKEFVFLIDETFSKACR